MALAAHKQRKGFAQRGNVCRIGLYTGLENLFDVVAAGGIARYEERIERLLGAVGLRSGHLVQQGSEPLVLLQIIIRLDQVVLVVRGQFIEIDIDEVHVRVVGIGLYRLHEDLTHAVAVHRHETEIILCLLNEYVGTAVLGVVAEILDAHVVQRQQRIDIHLTLLHIHAALYLILIDIDGIHIDILCAAGRILKQFGQIGECLVVILDIVGIPVIVEGLGVFEALLLRRILAPFRSKLHVLGKSLTAAQHCGGNDK